jgi:hypothetical protein
VRAVSEFARQLHAAIVEKGYTSPERTWEQYDILNELSISNGASYDWLRELEKAELIIRIPTASISHGDRFYAVPVAGLLSNRRPPRGSSELKSRAQQIATRHSRPVKQIDWTKWGTILTGLGIVVALTTWWFS